KPRLMLYPFLAVLPWLSPRLGRWGRAVAVAALALLALRPVTFALACWRAGGRDVEEFVHGLAAARPGSVVVPLNFDPNTSPCLWVCPVNHATGYAALAKGLVDWGDYEAAT